jgi:hypothetical protein
MDLTPEVRAQFAEARRNRWRSMSPAERAAATAKGRAAAAKNRRAKAKKKAES